MLVRPVLLMAMIACGSESQTPPPAANTETGSAGSAVGSPAPVPIDAREIPRSSRVEKVRAEMPDLGSIQRVVAQPDGKLLVIGEAGLARVDADLALDQSFGTGGAVRLELKEAELQTAAVDERGRVIVVGHVFTNRKREDLLVVRLKENGALDASFGTDGVVTRDFGETDDRPSAVFAMQDGDIVVIGSHQQGKEGQTYEGYLVRFDRHGQLRRKVAFFDCIPSSREFVTRASRDGEGFIVGGYAFNAKPEDSGVFVARVTEDGVLDPAFGARGVAHVHSKDLGRAVVWELASTKSGDVLLGGSSGDEIAKYRGFVARFDKHGTLIESWGKHGMAWAPREVKWISMAAEDNAGVLAVNRFDGSLTRFDEHGDTDLGFGTDGIVRGKKDDTYDNAVVVENGDIVIAGDKLLVRYAR